MRVYHHDEIVHIINSIELHIIKPKRISIIHALGVMIYKGVSAFDDIQALVLDDIPNLATLRFG